MNKIQNPMVKVSEIPAGTKISFLGEEFAAETVKVFPYGETILTDWHGNEMRLGSDTRVEILGHWNV